MEVEPGHSTDGTEGSKVCTYFETAKDILHPGVVYASCQHTEAFAEDEVAAEVKSRHFTTDIEVSTNTSQISGH